MEKIYIDLVQTSNFKYHPPIQFTFFPTKISYSINHSKILQKIFSERNFFYGKLDKYPDKRDYPIKGTIERIFHSRSRGLLQKDREKSRPNPRPSWPNIILWNSRTLQELKKKKKNKASLEWKSLVCIEKTDADIGGNDAEKLRCNPFAIVSPSLCPFSTTLCSHGACFVKSSLL